jgi:uncharacterized membrane protein YphA (DoxX/SURF4 family)
MVIVSSIAKLLLGVFFTPEGVIKWTYIGPSTARFVHFRYPRWFKYFTGVWELLVGIGMLVGLWFPLVAVSAAVLLSVEMLVAIYSHLVRGKDALSEIVPGQLIEELRLIEALVRGKDALSEIVPAVVFLLLALVVLIIHWGSIGSFLSHV